MEATIALISEVHPTGKMPLIMRRLECPPQSPDRLVLPVVHDTLRPLSGWLAKNSLPTTFAFTLDEALALADRHLAVAGEPDYPLQMVDDWMTIQHWEVNTFWEVDANANWLGANTSSGHLIATEHASRSGELLAECIAIRFLIGWLRIGRQAFRFIDSDTARPDYLVRKIKLFTPNNFFGLEVRLRKSPEPLADGKYRSYLTKQQWKSLDNKKSASNMQTHGIANIVGLYLFYGHSNRTRTGCQTRIHVADPILSDVSYNMNEAARALVDYYIGVTSRIGLWEYRDGLAQQLEQLARSSSSTTSVSVVKRPSSLIRSVEQQSYLCRQFSSLQMLWDNGQRDEVRSAVREGQFGVAMYRGVNKAVLDYVLEGRWTEALEFFDPNTGSIEYQGFPGTVESDGMLSFDHEIAVESQEADYYRTQFGS